MYTVLLVILHTTRENNVFENNIEEDIPKFSNLVLCFSFISIELFFYLNSELTWASNSLFSNSIGSVLKKKEIL